MHKDTRQTRKMIKFICLCAFTALLSCSFGILVVSNRESAAFQWWKIVPNLFLCWRWKKFIVSAEQLFNEDRLLKIFIEKKFILRKKITRLPKINACRFCKRAIKKCEQFLSLCFAEFYCNFKVARLFYQHTHTKD